MITVKTLDTTENFVEAFVDTILADFKERIASMENYEKRRMVINIKTCLKRKWVQRNKKRMILVSIYVLDNQTEYEMVIHPDWLGNFKYNPYAEVQS